jgi:uncharacterized membrane protein
MSKVKSLVMLAALATVLGAGTACFRLFGGSDEAAKDAEIEACAGLSGQARIDCEARHREQ